MRSPSPQCQRTQPPFHDLGFYPLTQQELRLLALAPKKLDLEPLPPRDIEGPVLWHGVRRQARADLAEEVV